jgi:hypothetical protein
MKLLQSWVIPPAMNLMVSAFCGGLKRKLLSLEGPYNSILKDYLFKRTLANILTFELIKRLKASRGRF